MLVLDRHFQLDEIEHVVDLIAAGQGRGVSVDRDILHADGDDVILGRTDVEIVALFQRTDAVVDVVENIDILIVVCGDKRVDAV